MHPTTRALLDACRRAALDADMRLIPEPLRAWHDAGYPDLTEPEHARGGLTMPHDCRTCSWFTHSRRCERPVNIDDDVSWAERGAILRWWETTRRAVGDESIPHENNDRDCPGFRAREKKA